MPTFRVPIRRKGSKCHHKGEVLLVYQERRSAAGYMERVVTTDPEFINEKLGAGFIDLRSILEIVEIEAPSAAAAGRMLQESFHPEDPRPIQGRSRPMNLFRV